ncbi:MAG TPA: monovalent cation:proton antiporter-2 (CPA2) family protein [Woeseiaceae bacterium]|nr:monovalent cation:proton antiporter-2 (CPA2) family protein [Woeseiaceae bacterium]
MLVEFVIYLVAAVIAVPISRALGFGSVLGYLAAGMLIGPFGIALVSDVKETMHIAEMGVVLLLFIIGLELQPSRLWVMRRLVFGLGTLQVLCTGLAIGIAAWLLGVPAPSAAVVGAALALSSTAFVLQMLAEKKELTTTYGRAAFSILLFQDLAVIPIIALLPLLGESGTAGFDLVALARSVGLLLLLIVGGRYLLRPVLGLVARTDIPELFTASALLVVIGAALLMQLAGMSMVLGAFVAGMLLADSEYRHQLEADIAPFKGLLLGLFFITVGMSVDLAHFLREPLRILVMVLGFMALKGLILVPLARQFGMCNRKASLRLAAAMSQGGEFAFVIFSLATRNGALAGTFATELTLAVTLSMLLTPLLYLAAERLTRALDATPAPDIEPLEAEENEVMIAGFGRVGQIVGRMLRMSGRPFTALEFDPEQVSIVRSYGNKVHFGDARRVEVLRAAGAARARLFVIATADMETSLAIAATLKRHFPHLTIVARARNRRHVHKLMDLGITHIFRDTLLSSIAMGERVFEQLGVAAAESSQLGRLFLERDERLLAEQYAVRDSEEKLIQTAKDTERELSSLLREDVRERAPR